MKKAETTRSEHATDLTDRQWSIIESFFSTEKRGSHLKKHSKRELVNAVLYLSKTGCQWRLLPKEFPNHVTVWSFYRRAIKSGLWEKILVCLVEKARVNAARKASPSYSLIDSQSVKTVSAAQERGFDGRKNKRKKAAYSN